MKFKNIKIGVVGMGYVGLPLAIEFGKKVSVLGYDKNLLRINQLKKKIDLNNDLSKKDFINSRHLKFINKILDLKKCNVFIICVPTPINSKNKPDLLLLKKACIANFRSQFRKM